jgi:peptidyl-prolyl cis-trans isomerase D
LEIFCQTVARGGGRGDNVLAEINGEKILGTDFNQRVEENMEAQKLNTNKENLTSDEQFQIRQQTWDQVVNETLLQEEVAKLGITVSIEELDDQISGKEPA